MGRSGTMSTADQVAARLRAGAADGLPRKASFVVLIMPVTQHMTQ